MPNQAVFTTSVDDEFRIWIGESQNPLMGNPSLTRQYKGTVLRILMLKWRSQWTAESMLSWPCNKNDEQQKREEQQLASDKLVIAQRVPKMLPKNHKYYSSEKWLLISCFNPATFAGQIVKSQFANCWCFFCLVPKCCLFIRQFCRWNRWNPSKDRWWTFKISAASIRIFAGRCRIFWLATSRILPAKSTCWFTSHFFCRSIPHLCWLPSRVFARQVHIFAGYLPVLLPRKSTFYRPKLVFFFAGLHLDAGSV